MSEQELREAIRETLRGCMAYQAGAAFGVPVTGRAQYDDAIADALLPLIREREARLVAEASTKTADDINVLLPEAYEAARAEGAAEVRARMESLHQRLPADSPFNHEGRDVCDTCTDGCMPADWPCPTIAALRDAIERY